MPGPGVGGRGEGSAAASGPGRFVCGSGYRGQLLPRGRVPRVYVQKGGVSLRGRGPNILPGGGRGAEKGSTLRRTGVPALRGQGPWGGLRELSRIGREPGVLWRRQGGLHWVKAVLGAPSCFTGFRTSFLKGRGDPRTEWTESPATGKEQPVHSEKLAIPEHMLSELRAEWLNR